MSLYDSDRRYRRRFWGGMLRLILFVALIGATAIVSYQFGIEDLESQVRGYQQEIFDLENRHGQLEQETANLRVAAERAKLTVEEWERRYAADVPAGERRRMLELATERLQAGVSPDRLAFLIKSADDPRDCEPVESKRFLVRTPLYDGKNTVVSFADDAIVVSGSGESAKTADGLPQAWFDPQLPVTVEIKRIDGEVREVAGVLPLNGSIVQGGTEHRFQMRAGATGFIQIAAERCAYP
ncbi:MAG: hypothetical protein RLO51_19940 [Thalassobaculum sp.]|uniref:hypothetical protein n=1 Tax=Thalassobaculum sp. TaxID=2022740 RepID=UPI0032EE471B